VSEPGEYVFLEGYRATDARPRTVTFDVTDERVHRYCVHCSAPPNLLIGEGVSLGINGPIPWGLEPDREIWGYIVGYDSATRRLEVAPKR